MKNTLSIAVTGLACFLTFSDLASASPLPRQRIPADAKWLFHADLVGFRASQIGHYVQTNFLSGPLKEVSSNLKFDAEALLRTVTSVTAYGSDFKKNDPEASLTTGVLILQTDAETQQIVEGALAAQLLANTNSPLKKLQTQPYPLYAVGKDLFGAIQPDGVILLGKSRERIDQATQVLEGKLPSLLGGKAFTDFPATSDSFVFLGVAEGFDQLLELPPQAKVLHMADGLRIVLGENADVLFADLALKSKTQEVVTQIQQVLQGLIALFSLGAPENQDLSELVRSTKVTTADKVVAVGMQFPVAKALALIAKGGQQDSDTPKPERKSSKPGKKRSKHHEEPEIQPEATTSQKPEPKAEAK